MSLALGLAAPATALAALGGQVDSVAADQAQMQGAGAIKTTATPSYTVHEIRAASGIAVREYVSPAGTVFGVAWAGPFRPDLRLLLGSYFDSFQQGATAAVQRRARGPLTVAQPGLVVHLGGRQRAFFGQAYLPAQVPAGLSPGDIQ